MKKIFENAVWWSGVIMVGLILGISLQFVRAWTEPIVAPPNGNVGAPLNTGLIEQLKQGALGINGLLKLYAGFQMPTGAGAGKVLTSDAAGNAAWAAGGGGGMSYTQYCCSSATRCTPVCPAHFEMGTQSICASGFKVMQDLGVWQEISWASGDCGNSALRQYAFLPATITAGSAFDCGTWTIGRAYLCSE